MAILAFVFGMVWGSFLNAFSYRIINGISLQRRSFCPQCKNTILWYDLFPVVSWCVLRGRCRSCNRPISLLYPIIELGTACLFAALVILIPQHYVLGYAIFISALLVTIRSDAEYMLISRAVTLYLVPLIFLLSLNGYLPLTIFESIVGATGGYLFLWAVAAIFKGCTGKDGMGQGDIDLLAFIGSGIGLFGCWITILIGSITGSVVALYIFLVHGVQDNEPIRIPFGIFLSLGALSFVFFEQYITVLLLGGAL